MSRSPATRCLVSVLAAISVCWSGAATAQFDSPRPLQRVSDEYLALLMKGSYDELERAANEAHKNTSMTSDGQPRLSALYDCVGCADRLTDELWKLRRKRLQEWRAHYPASVSAKIALASFSIQYAWFARGFGYANTVSQESWALFKDRIETARKELEGLDEATKRDPGWYAAMLDVALAQGWPSERFDALYEEAVQKHPTFLPIHFTAASYYSPKWHGSMEKLRSVVEHAVEITRPQLGETLYARLNWSASTNEMFENGQADWPRMKAGFERMIKDFPDPWNVNNYAKFACLAGDPRTVNRLAATIGDKPIAAAWFGDVRMYEVCKRVIETK
jgi:hypothetical protein